MTLTVPCHKVFSKLIHSDIYFMNLAVPCNKVLSKLKYSELFYDFGCPLVTKCCPTLHAVIFFMTFTVPCNKVLSKLIYSDIPIFYEFDCPLSQTAYIK